MVDINNSVMGNNLGLYDSSTHYIKRKVSVQNISAAKQNEEKSAELNEHETKRQTYGLAILELMSDQEYQAWLRATAGMTETEKMLAVQKLYPLADLEKLKASKHMRADEKQKNLDSVLVNKEIDNPIKPFIINANRINGMKIFNANSDFIQRYKNEFENINANVDING